jgi:predicted molibdopterin-dependent oxidoreductase YjgC
MSKFSGNSRAITLNGVRTEILPDETLLQVAARNGIQIPTLCYDPRLSISGHCKVCLVDVDGKLKASCMTRAEHGMVVLTHSDKVLDIRKKRVQTILKQHKGDCASCAQNEFCGLRELAVSVGLERPTFSSPEPAHVEMIEDKLQINFDKCIRCGKCVRVCADIRKVGALRHPVLSPGADKITFDKKCERCGQCAVICPTGAIVEVYRGRPDERVKSVCTYCATGCSIYLDVKNDEVIGVTTDELDPIGKGNLCVKGRFGFSFIHHPDRLTTPLLRMHGTFVTASWDEAIGVIAERLTDIKKRHNADAIGGIGSARATNEDNYLFQRMMRAAVGTKTSTTARVSDMRRLLTPWAGRSESEHRPRPFRISRIATRSSWSGRTPRKRTRSLRSISNGHGAGEPASS